MTTTKLPRWRECCCAREDDSGDYVEAEGHERVVAELEAQITSRGVLIGQLLEERDHARAAAAEVYLLLAELRSKST